MIEIRGFAPRSAKSRVVCFSVPKCIYFKIPPFDAFMFRASVVLVEFRHTKMQNRVTWTILQMKSFRLSSSWLRTILRNL